jgi:hypothetical protein
MHLLAPIIEEFKRWRVILATDFKRYMQQVNGNLIVPPLGVEPS